ncbi:MAG: hypothetical protein QOE65_825 [Solirubrobacteraceae bacterium]|jgi:hypothetical protein|nr:hypothetical protein [Solirubrobacteraceae bacterium]
MITRILRVLAVAAAVAGFAAPAASADGTAELIFEDGLLLSPGDAATAPGIASQWRNRLGADWVRIQAYWDAVSPNPTSTTRPAGFSVANQADARYHWTDLDRAVSTARGAGLRVFLTIHQCGPRWASSQPSSPVHCWKPKAALYGQFASAVARRYASQVDRYAAGNEPNQKVFLQPQSNFAAAGLYRDMVNAAYPAIKRADRGSTVVIGELAPIGAASRFAGNLAPLPFIRAMYCRDNRYRRIRTGSCRRFRVPRGDIWGIHPYQVRERPDQPQRNPNLAKLGDLRRLFAVLDRSSGRRFNFYITEYGYETNPTDARNGVSPALQSRYLQQSAYIAWATPRIKLHSQYLWRDDGAVSGFQTGLFFTNGSPKPSLSTFPHPFWIDTKRGRTRAVIWGQVRPDGVSSVQVFRQVGGGAFTPFLTLRLASRGYFSARRSLVRGSNYYYEYQRGGQTFRSDTMHVS